ncbi:hypothetical protein EC52239_3024, partial [Escherichia coli 5.2239]
MTISVLLPQSFPLPLRSLALCRGFCGLRNITVIL